MKKPSKQELARLMRELGHRFNFEDKVKQYKCSNCELMFYNTWSDNETIYYIFDEYTKLTCNEIIVREILK
jgi:hypothetical protein